MRRRRVTYRPSKAQGAFGLVWGGMFVLIGLFVVVPVFGPFGILWTLAALGITAMNGLHAFGKKYVGPEIRIEDEEGGGEAAGPREGSAPASPAPEDHGHIPSTALNARERLEQLNSLKEAGLITGEEYDRKREEILSGL